MVQRAVAYPLRAAKRQKLALQQTKGIGGGHVGAGVGVMQAHIRPPWLIEQRIPPRPCDPGLCHQRHHFQHEPGGLIRVIEPLAELGDMNGQHRAEFRHKRGQTSQLNLEGFGVVAIQMHG